MKKRPGLAHLKKKKRVVVEVSRTNNEWKSCFPSQKNKAFRLFKFLGKILLQSELNDKKLLEGELWKSGFPPQMHISEKWS